MNATLQQEISACSVVSIVTSITIRLVSQMNTTKYLAMCMKAMPATAVTQMDQSKPMKKV
jgi:hypothetical protein